MNYRPPANARGLWRTGHDSHRGRLGSHRGFWMWIFQADVVRASWSGRVWAFLRGDETRIDVSGGGFPDEATAVEWCEAVAEQDWAERKAADVVGYARMEIDLTDDECSQLRAMIDGFCRARSRPIPAAPRKKRKP